MRGNLAGEILVQNQFTLPIFENTGLDAFVKLYKHQLNVGYFNTMLLKTLKLKGST